MGNKLRHLPLLFSGTILLLQACNSAGVARQQLLWGASPKETRTKLDRRELHEIKAYLNEHRQAPAMQEALLLGEDSLYLIALIFAEEKEWNLYRRAMITQSYSGSPIGREIALAHMAEHKIFSDDERLSSLRKYLENAPEDQEQLLQAVSLALGKGKVEEAQRYWEKFLAANSQQIKDFGLMPTELGLRLALLNRNRSAANQYMRQLVLNFTGRAAHEKLHQELQVRPEWSELLRSSTEGPQLLQSLDWKVALLQKRYSATLPILFAPLPAGDARDNALAFWWREPTLIEDSGRAMVDANNYRSQSRNVENGRKYLQYLLERTEHLSLSQNAWNSLAYWYLRNRRNYANMEKYRSQLRKDDQLRSWLLVQYLYFFQNAKHWPDFNEFLHSWYREQPGDLSLNRSSIRLFQQIYRAMLFHKKTSLLKQAFANALEWEQEELILESAWNYRLAKGRALSRAEWQQIPATLRQRVLADIRLFVLRADQGEPMLPRLAEHEPKKPPAKTRQSLEQLLSTLISQGFNNEALRLARLYHNELAASSIVDFARSIQLQGQYDVSMRMVAQLTYDKNYSMSREALELFYPKAFFDLMSNYSKNNDLPLSIFYGLVRQESYFAPLVVSRAGAVGLSQLMPGTMREVARRIGFRNPDARDPESNLKIGSYYLRYLIDHRWTNDFGQALMAYNAGLGNVRRWKARLRGRRGLEFNSAISIPETRLYVPKISAGAIYYAELYGWDRPNSVLQTIYPDDFPQY